jgi:hypothetical protein
MALRTTRSSITFAAPFDLKGVAGTFPAGSYDVETEEEIIEGMSHTVYLRVATLLYVRTIGMTRTLTVDPKHLQDALDRDRAGAAG